MVWQRQYLRMILYLAYLELPVVLIPILSGSFRKTVLAFEILFAAIAAYGLTAASRRFRHPFSRFMTAFFPAVLIFFFEFLQLISFVLQGESFNEQFFYHMGLNSVTVGARAYEWMVVTPILATLILGIMDVLLNRHVAAIQSTKKAIFAWILVLVSIGLLPNAPKKYVLESYRETHSSSSWNPTKIKAELKKRGVHISAFSNEDIKAAPQPSSKNLILIYLESLESAYLDETQFPGLVPNIKKAIAEGLEFTNLSEYPGTSWTMGGVFASQCGMPLGGLGNDSIDQSPALESIKGLGDVLNKAGYYQVYIGGADLSFAGKGKYYQTHGYQEVLGYQELKPIVPDPSYVTGWGLYDDTLLDMAAQKFNALIGQHEKVNLTLLTLDTHHPNGAASKSCPPYSHSSNSMLQAVHCTDYLFGKFLKSLQQNERYPNTLIFVMSDHLAMNNVAMHLYPKGKRKLMAFALNAGLTGKIDIAGAHFDIAPTILDMLSIQTNVQFPLGQSLLKPEQPDRFAVYQDNGYELLKDYLRAVDKQTAPINICSGDGIKALDTPDYTIRIGGHPVLLSRDGRPIYPENHIFIVQCTMDGLMQRYRIATEKEAAEIVENDPDAFYLMLTKYARIPFGLGPEKIDDNWKAYLGNPSSLAGIAGETPTPQFDQIVVDAKVCRKVLADCRQGSPKIFSIRKRVQHLQQNLQVARRQSATAYGHFCPETIEVVSSSVAGNESHILLDEMLLKATQGITLAAIDPLFNSIARLRSYNIIDSPDAANALLNDLNSLNTDKIVLITFQGSFALPGAIIRAFEKLGAREIRSFVKGQPYILMANARNQTAFEAIGKPGTIITRRLSVYDNEGSVSSIKQLWNSDAIIIQSASNGAGRSYGIIKNTEVPKIGRGLHVLILDSDTRAVRLNDQFDTYADAASLKRLSNVLRKANSNEIVIVFANDSATGGPLGTELPEFLKADFKRLGAVCADEIAFRTPYIFLTRIGSDFHIEKCSQEEGVLQVELTLQETGKLFSSANRTAAPEP